MGSRSSERRPGGRGQRSKGPAGGLLRPGWVTFPNEGTLRAPGTRQTRVPPQPTLSAGGGAALLSIKAHRPILRRPHPLPSPHRRRHAWARPRRRRRRGSEAVRPGPTPSARQRAQVTGFGGRAQGAGRILSFRPGRRASCAGCGEACAGRWAGGHRRALLPDRRAATAGRSLWAGLRA